MIAKGLLATALLFHDLQLPKQSLLGGRICVRSQEIEKYQQQRIQELLAARK